MASRPRAALQARAGQQLGYFSTADARDCGISPSALSRMRKAGEVVRVRQRVYRFTAVPPTAEGAAMAALLAVGHGAVVSHRSSLRLQGITRVDEPAEIDVTTTGIVPSFAEGLVLHRTSTLPPCDVVTHARSQRLRLTTGARSLIDLAGEHTWDEVLALTDDIICERLSSRRWLHRRASALSNGRAGVRAIAQVTRPGAEAEFWSWLERRASALWDQHGIPQPEWNVEVRDARGLIGTVDSLWRGACVIGELEGLRFHTQPAQRRKDAERFNRLGKHHRVLRFTWLDVVRRPAYVVEMVRDGLGLVDSWR